MAQTKRLHTRNSRSLPVIVRVVLVLFALVVAGIWIFSSGNPSARRITVVLVSNPIHVWSWDAVSDNFTVVSLPSDSVIEGVHGYGEYSLESLWKLGIIDKKGGTLLDESLEETLGIPVNYYIGDRLAGLPDDSDAIAQGRKIFTPLAIARLYAEYRTNMPIGDFWRMAVAMANSRLDKFQSYDFSHNEITYEKDLADGTKQSFVDVQRVDSALKGVFEDDDIRKEALSVAVYNTTEVPYLGNRAARLLTNVGIFVSTVGNDKPEVKNCLIWGNKQAIASVTATVMASILSCERQQKTDITRADLEIRIGSKYASRFSSPSN